MPNLHAYSRAQVSDNPPQEFQSDSDKEAWLNTRVARGMTLKARIMKIRFDKFLVDLSCRSQDLKNRKKEEVCLP
mgnify:CR=1 FL=1